MASLGIKIELLLTVAAVIGIGMAVQAGLVSKEYAGIGLGFLTGTGLRSVVGSSTVPAVAPTPPAPAIPPPASYTSTAKFTYPADTTIPQEVGYSTTPTVPRVTAPYPEGMAKPTEPPA
jgi:hypothetical protein